MKEDWDAPWKYGFAQMDFKSFRTLPSFSSNRNPVCLKCRKHKRGSKRHKTCRCDIPEFDEVQRRIADMQAFQDWCTGWLVECIRVLEPGGLIKAFSGTRTRHRLAVAMEQVGFSLEAQEAWCYGLGFPKSLNVSKALDKYFGAEREVLGRYQLPPDANSGRAGKSFLGRGGGPRPGMTHEFKQAGGVISRPATPEAERFDGYGTALKPAWEPVLVGRKP